MKLSTCLGMHACACVVYLLQNIRIESGIMNELKIIALKFRRWHNGKFTYSRILTVATNSSNSVLLQWIAQFKHNFSSNYMIYINTKTITEN